MKIRVGFGFDVHQLVAGRELWLGGIRLEHEKGLLGHSDADVLIHTICDALLGAANMRDIGYHFPDTAGEFKDTFAFAASTAAFSAGSVISRSVCALSAGFPEPSPVCPEAPPLWSTHPARRPHARAVHARALQILFFSSVILIFIIVISSAPSPPVFPEEIYDQSRCSHQNQAGYGNRRPNGKRSVSAGSAVCL